MKIKNFLTVLLIAFTLAACASAVAVVSTETTTPSSTFTPAPTLPPTLTPVPTLAQAQMTPTASYVPVELSSEDNKVYQKAMGDIPIYREGDIQLLIQDENGNPLSGFQVKYRQISHDFLFGGVADPFSTTELKKAGINTNTAYMYWRWLQPEEGKFQLDFANYWLGLDELKSAGMTVRANAFYDAADLPPFYANVPYKEFLNRLYEHESAVVKRFAPSVDYWEAVLEPNFGNHNPLSLTKDEYYQGIATSIQAIRDNDPTATVEINLSYPCGGIDWLNNYQIVQELLDRNIDFDVVGLQFYYNAYIGAGNYQMTKMSLGELSTCYDKYEKMLTPYGKKVVGSEFSVPSEAPAGQIGYWNTPWSEDTQAQYLTTAYTIFFSKPSNLGLVWWNTVEPSPFVYHGGLIKDDDIPKKSYYALQRLIESWTTAGKDTTDQSGTAKFRGFGGDYEIEIVNPVNGESMVTQLHVTEQSSTSETIKYVSNNLLLEKKAKLEKLISYWEAKSNHVLVQKGKDYLALLTHHFQNAEWSLAEQTLNAALDDLSIQIEVTIPASKLIPVGSNGEGFTMENGSALIWGATTLHFPYAFPAGTVTVEIKAHGQSEKGESPRMVSGVGANYSQVWKVENTQTEVYSYTVFTTGREQDFTIRFPYIDEIFNNITAQNGNGGELKLYIDNVKLIIKTTEIP